MENSIQLKKFNVSFVGRLSGAIGITYKINDVLEMPKESTHDEINLKLYDKYELISKLKINGKLYKS